MAGIKAPGYKTYLRREQFQMVMATIAEDCKENSENDETCAHCRCTYICEQMRRVEPSDGRLIYPEHWNTNRMKMKKIIPD